MIIRVKSYLIFFWITVTSICILLNSNHVIGQELKTDTVASPADKHDSVFALRDSVLSYFYPANGLIAGIEKDTVIIKVQSDKKFNKGTRFSVFRKGKPYYHPVTEKPIGITEDLIGSVEIKEADKDAYICRIVSGDPEIGDIVRITSSRIKLAFFQDKKAGWELSEAVYDSLKDSGRFELVESYTKTYDPKELAKLATDLGAEAVLLFSTPVRKEGMFMNTKLFWSEDAAPFAEIENIVDTSHIQEFASQDKLIPIISAEGVPWGNYELASGKFFAMGDVDGNGEKELVVSDGINVRVYSYKNEPRESWFLKGSKANEHLFVEVFDLNKNGRAEIFVTSVKNERVMSSFVLEYDPVEGYRKIWEKSPYAYRVIGENVLMQVFSPYKAFTGPVYSGIWKDGLYQTASPLKLPKGVDIFGFTSVDWQNDGNISIIAFDDNGYLNLYRDEVLLWRSKSPYIKFDTEAYKTFSYTDSLPSATDHEKKWFMKGRLVTVSTERGQEVIVIKKVPYLSNVPGLGTKRAEVYSFWWDGGIMDETLILSEIKGTVTDYWVEGQNLLILTRLNLFGYLSKTLSGNLKRKSILYYYSLGDK
jgi:hypothetical protein